MFRSALISVLLLTLTAAAPQLHPRAAKYEGYKVVRVSTGDNLKEVSDKLAGLSYDQWNRDTSKHIDLALSPNEARKIKDLGLDFKELHKDLGLDIASEGQWKPWPGMY
jgi:hypothetical protein